MATTLTPAGIGNPRMLTPVRKIHRKLPPPGGNGGNGGNGRGGVELPEMPEGNDIGRFLQFVHDLLQFWVDRVDRDRKNFTHLDNGDRDAIKAGWKDFHEQWESQREVLMRAASFLQSPDLKADMQRRGLTGDSMTMKWHAMGKYFGAFRQKLDFRKHWRKLLQSVDIILDSTKDVLATVAPVFPGASAIASGLKEFKDVSMTVSEP